MFFFLFFVIDLFLYKHVFLPDKYRQHYPENVLKSVCSEEHCNTHEDSYYMADSYIHCPYVDVFPDEVHEGLRLSEIRPKNFSSFLRCVHSNSYLDGGEKGSSKKRTKNVFPHPRTTRHSKTRWYFTWTPYEGYTIQSEQRKLGLGFAGDGVLSWVKNGAGFEHSWKLYEVFSLDQANNLVIVHTKELAALVCDKNNKVKAIPVGAIGLKTDFWVMEDIEENES